MVQVRGVSGRCNCMVRVNGIDIDITIAVAIGIGSKYTVQVDGASE